MNIQSIKLVTGEEIIADVTDVNDEQVFVENPLVLRISAGPEGLVVNFFPWTVIAQGKIQIELHAIVARFSVPKDVEDNYIANTTGLQIISALKSPQILKG